MITWTADWEDYPDNSKYGSVTCSALREIKEETQTRYSIQHLWETTATGPSTHREGQCSIIGIYTGTLSLDTTLVREGGLWWADDTNALYRISSGLTPVALGGFDHNTLADRDSSNQHTQYIPIAGASASYPLVALDLNGNNIRDITAVSGGDVETGAHQHDGSVSTPNSHTAGCITAGYVPIDSGIPNSRMHITTVTTDAVLGPGVAEIDSTYRFVVGLCVGSASSGTPLHPISGVTAAPVTVIYGFRAAGIIRPINSQIVYTCVEPS